jgi:arylsulfatase A
MSTSPIGTYVSRVLLTALTMGAALTAREEQQASASRDTETITAIVYADNWFEMYVNGRRVAVDPIRFRPHNVVTFELKAEYPMTIAIRAEDNADPRTGMEYDDTQIGDGGFALRLSDGTVTDASWRAQCFSRGPVGGDVQNPSVERDSLPGRWFAPDFDDGDWASAVEFSSEQVDPKACFFEHDFGAARFVWSEDLALDNTVLLRTRIEAPRQTSAAGRPSTAAPESDRSSRAKREQGGRRGGAGRGAVAKPPLPETVGVEIDSACDFELWIDGELVAVDPIAGAPQLPLSFEVVARYPMSIEARLTDPDAASDLRVRVGGHELPRSAWQVVGGEERAGALVLATVFDHVHGSHADPAEVERSTPASTAIPARPNIILLLSDDQGWSGLSTPMHPEHPGASSDRIRTPNIATLGRDGLRFSQAYSAAPVCSPSRVGIQTGKNPAALHWTKAARSVTPEDGYRLIPPVSARMLPDEEVTVGEVLRRAGYTTAHFGKWHLGGGGPGQHGYDVHDGDTSNQDAAPHKDPNPVDIFGMVERADAFIGKAAEEGRPFFAQLSFHALHYPENARAATLEAVEERGGWRNEKEMQRAAIAEDLDEGVGRLLAAIEARGLSESTIVIYTSDNGQGAGGRGALLSGGKGGLEEGGIRVPFLVRGPGVPQGAWCHEPIVGFDFLPTFAELAGVTEGLPRELEGTSFAQLLSNPDHSLARKPHGLVFHFPHYQGPAGPQSTIRVGDLKLVLSYETGETALYDLATDPGETRDLSAERARETQELKALLQDHLEHLGADLPRPNPRFEEGSDPPSRRERKARGDRPPADRENPDRGEGGRRREHDEAQADLAPAVDGWAEVPPEARPFLAFEGLEVSWDEDFVYVESDGLPDHPMMVGIRTWNQQVPLPQSFRGDNAFRIPRKPKLLDEPRETVLVGPIAIAVNGVPIFDPTTQSGRHDAHENGELDEFGGHAGRADDYHYHVAPFHLAEVVGEGSPIAFGLDGFPIYGKREPDGSAMEPLDAAHGHRHADGTYHYHGTDEKPYFMGAFAGEVDLDARPETRSWRPYTRPLRGARISGFTGSLESGYQLEYTLRGETHRIDYHLREDGGVEFLFVNPDGTARTETYPAPRERGERRGGPDADGDGSGRGDRREEGPRGRGSDAAGSGGDDTPPRQPWILAHAAELDADGDGVLTLDEVRAEVAAAVEGFDANADGRLSDAELDSGVRVRSAVAGFLRGHRAELDTDGDGGIEKVEVLAVFERFHRRHDSDGDGAFSTASGKADDRQDAGEAERERSTAAAPPSSRGLVVVLLDDMGWNDVGFMGNEFVETPRLDQLAAEGLVFDAAYASAPNCAPTRACLLSGQWPGRHGVYTVVDERNVPGLPHHRLLAASSRPELGPEFVTFAEALGEAGYATGFFGMWNLGKGESGPEGQGFDTTVVPRDLGFGKNAYRDESGRQLPDALTAKALQFIESHSDEPFLCYLALHSVHAPFDPDPGLLAKYEGRAGRGDDSAFAATVEAVDRNIGRLMDHLRELGIAESSTVIFTSDNGGEHRRTPPLRGGKGELYEGGIRVPLVAWGAGVRGGRRSETPVSSLDLYPTLLELAGLEVGAELDGASLLPLLSDSGTLQRDELFWHFPCYTGRGTPASAVRAGNWKLVQRYEEERAELYDLDDDPGEAVDLFAERPELARRLEERLDDWLSRTQAELPGGRNPDFDLDARRPGGGSDKGNNTKRREKRDR